MHTRFALVILSLALALLAAPLPTTEDKHVATFTLAGLRRHLEPLIEARARWSGGSRRDAEPYVILDTIETRSESGDGSRRREAEPARWSGSSRREAEPARWSGGSRREAEPARWSGGSRREAEPARWSGGSRREAEPARWSGGSRREAEPARWSGSSRREAKVETQKESVEKRSRYRGVS